MEISIYEPVDLIITLMKTTINGMTDRIRRLRQESFDTQPSLSIERALIETEFYKENEGKPPVAHPLNCHVARPATCIHIFAI